MAPAHPDRADDVVAVARVLDPPGALRCLDAILGCREALDLNVKPRIAVEAMTAALRLPDARVVPSDSVAVRRLADRRARRPVPHPTLFWPRTNQRWSDGR